MDADSQYVPGFRNDLRIAGIVGFYRMKGTGGPLVPPATEHPQGQGERTESLLY
jgi:hypothetical protein